ncbi:MAG: hypothetical protein AABM67_20120, partial [Acidobacteriota bacterium]
LLSDRYTSGNSPLARAFLAGCWFDLTLIALLTYCMDAAALVREGEAVGAREFIESGSWSE